MICRRPLNDAERGYKKKAQQALVVNADMKLVWSHLVPATLLSANCLFVNWPYVSIRTLLLRVKILDISGKLLQLQFGQSPRPNSNCGNPRTSSKTGPFCKKSRTNLHQRAKLKYTSTVTLETHLLLSVVIKAIISTYLPL